MLSLQSPYLINMSLSSDEGQSRAVNALQGFGCENGSCSAILMQAKNALITNARCCIVGAEI